MEEVTRTMLGRQLDFASLLVESTWGKFRERFPPSSVSLSEMPSALEFIGAIITRALFVIHALVVIWIVLQLYSGNDVYWAVCIGLCFLAVETLFTLIIRKGLEYKYVWPSCFFYLCTVVPCVWILHMNMLQSRMSGTRGPTLQISGVTIDEGFASKLCELGLVLIIIAGRWILPRGLITRDQLSALLLEYVAIAADILELFGAFEEDQVEKNFPVTMAILLVYSWSLLQFTFSFTAFVDEEDDEEDNNENQNKNEPAQLAIRKELMPAASRKYLRRLIHEKKKEKTKPKAKERKAYRISGRSGSQISLTDKTDKSKETILKMQLHGDTFGILAAIFMQDGPFLILRLYLIIALGVKGDLQIFFAGKNAITLALLFYRLLSVQCLKKEDERTPYQRFRAASIAIVSVNVFRSQLIKDNNNRPHKSGSLNSSPPIKQLSFETPA